MLELDRSYLGFKTKTVYFADQPFDVEKVDWVQFNHIRKKLEIQGFERQEYINGILDLTRGTEQLWSDISSKYRSDIRKSEKEDVIVHLNENVEDFLSLNERFREAKNLGPLGPLFQHYLKPPLPDFCTLFTAEHNGEMIGGILFLKDDKEMQGILAPTKRLEVTKVDADLITRANRRLWWEAVTWGLENSIEILDMGYYPMKNTDPNREGGGEFKRRFGAEAMHSYIYRKLYSRKAKIVSSYRAMIRGKR